MKKSTVGRISGTVLAIATLISAGIVSGLPQASAAPEELAAQTQSRDVHWKKCADAIDGYPNSELQCASIKVPLDYNRPGGRKISVKISRVKAANPQMRRGVIFLNPGGPGGPGVALPQLFAMVMSPTVTEHYDLIGFDPRGVGESTPVSCGLNPDDAAKAMVPQGQPGGFSATSAFMEKVAKSCQRTSGDLMPYMTTANTARDMDQIRQALGVSKISYLGYSYGTYLGAVYASKYPNRTDRFVLDSSVSPDWAWRDQFRAWRMADRDRFPDFANYLIANENEFRMGKTDQEVSSNFTRLVNKFNTTPLVFEDGTVFTGESFRLLTFGGLYNDGNFPELGFIWQYADSIETPSAASAKTALKKSMESLAGEAETASDNSAASALAVLCGDAQWGHDPAQYQAELTADTTIAPKFGPVGSNIWPCAFWQTAPKEPLTTISSTGPRNILMIQNTRDPATPYSGAQEMRNRLGQRVQFVTVDQGGHAAAYLAANQCATDAVDAYFAGGALAKHDTTCAIQHSLRAASTSTTGKDAVLRTLRQRIR